jgi:hypothetical protein
MAKLIVTLEVDVERLTEEELADWKRIMGLATKDISDMAPDLTIPQTAENIAELVGYMLLEPRVGGPNGELWGGSEMLAKLTDAQVRSARWEG